MSINCAKLVLQNKSNLLHTVFTKKGTEILFIAFIVATNFCCKKWTSGLPKALKGQPLYQHPNTPFFFYMDIGWPVDDHCKIWVLKKIQLRFIRRIWSHFLTTTFRGREWDCPDPLFWNPQRHDVCVSFLPFAYSICTPHQTGFRRLPVCNLDSSSLTCCSGGL